MRARIVALTLFLSVILAGCGSLLDRDYTTETPHTQFIGEDSDADILRAETYQGLVSAVLHLVSEGQEKGVIHLYNYDGEAERDVDAACLEVTQKDPLGAYAVEYMKYDVTRVRTYYEAKLSIVYRRTPQQIAAVVSVTGTNAIRSELLQTLSEYRGGVTFRVSYFNESENKESIRKLVEDAYYDVPNAALGMPGITVNLYPASGQQRLVEILLTYPAEASVLQQRQEELLSKVEGLTANLPAQSEADRLTAITGLLAGVKVVGGGQGCSSAWSALQQGKADNQGMALAAQVLCRNAGLDSKLMRGTRNGHPWFWNEVCMNNQWSYLDLTRKKPRLMSQEEMDSRGYVWDRSENPANGKIVEKP